jgi:hypothetical protein
MSTEQSLKHPISHAELKRKAMQIFFFDDDDLPSNRDGRLSDKQKQRFITATRTITAVFVLSGLILSAVFVWTWEEPLDQLPWIIPALTAASFTVIAIYGYRLGAKVHKSGVVKCAVGTVTFKKWPDEPLMQIDGKYFRSNRKFREIFMSGIQYKVYYAPSDNTIVSVEIVD